MTEEGFKVGVVVYLKSGSQPMTVVSSTKELTNLIWYSGRMYDPGFSLGKSEPAPNPKSDYKPGFEEVILQTNLLTKAYPKLEMGRCNF